jgi:signal transduction histidine kinase
MPKQETLRAHDEVDLRMRNLEHREAAMGDAELTAARADLMEALGQLAGGMAHDFNNVLQAISGAGEMLHDQFHQPQAIVRIARKISSAVERGASVTERLLAFARCSNLRAIPLDTEQVLNDLHPLLAQTLGTSIAIRTNVESALPPLMADKRQLETILINLAMNARDAMPVGGAMTLSATKLTVCRDSRDVPRFGSGNYIKIVVSDTGTGMDEATLLRATEPFFTTKSTGKGTGLGLSVAKGFSEQSGGGLLIKSSLGSGTAVSIVLPVAEVILEGHRERINDLAQTRILLVDDDILVRDVLLESAEFSATFWRPVRCAHSRRATVR